VADTILEHRVLLVLTDAPSLLHHYDEVVVRGGAHSKVRVVLEPLIVGDFAVVVASEAVKGVKEFGKYLIRGVSTFFETLVLGDVVNGCDVTSSDKTRTIFVHQRKRSFDHLTLPASEFLSKSTQELLVANVAVLVDIVVRHKSLQVDFLGEKTKSVRYYYENWLRQG